MPVTAQHSAITADALNVGFIFNSSEKAGEWKRRGDVENAIDPTARESSPHGGHLEARLVPRASYKRLSTAR
ncbi:hypothetical protein Airi02_044490 [Actinoallomurus iriomotensis]|uniref:Uncharacterized protein n=1 Tax=Actinoallomurus iriomotensis TaxID=478107 RepID=A0A9W6S1X7_9ACTN|nr:hypothetical protein Airi02_044490 [Actinoallomurus iriomotensis]